MSAAESARHGTVHEQESKGEGHAQTSRARTRDSVTDTSAQIIDITRRSRARVAERWGKPIEEPPATQHVASDGSGQKALTSVLQAGLNNLHVVRDPSPSLAAYWHDHVEGGRRLYESSGLPITVAYWTAGIPGLAVIAICKAAETAVGRPGRTAATTIVLLLVWGALTLAGHNPI